MFKRKYLNRIEENYFLMTACLMLFINGQSEGCNDKGMLKEYEDNKMFSSSTHKNFKLGITYLKKFLQETFDNLDKPTQDRIKKKTNKFLIKFINILFYGINCFLVCMRLTGKRYKIYDLLCFLS